MLTRQEEELVKAHARLPEQIVPYVTAVSGGEPFLLDDFVFYRSGRSLVFVGYPLRGQIDTPRLGAALGDAVRRLEPDAVLLISPLAEAPGADYEMRASDRYYCLSLPLGRVPAKVANTLRRASRDVQVLRGTSLDKAHLQLLREFLATRDLDPQTASLLGTIPRYVTSCSSAALFTAYDSRGRAVGFSVADYWADKSAFYMFNITTKKDRTPGVSDLLLNAIIEEARAVGKVWINLGLGVSKGITFFKTKWGAQPACEYYYFCNPSPKRTDPSAFLRRLLHR